MSKCARTGCFKTGVMRCSICLREPYCSGDCQKEDWKAHKQICKALKKLSLHPQPYHQVVQVTQEIRERVKELDIRFLKHFISYLNHQFGDRVPGKDYREKDNERIDNWQVEVIILAPFYHDLASIYLKMHQSLSMAAMDDLVFPYLEKSLNLLRPWYAYLDLNSTNQVGNLDKVQINYLLLLSSEMECNIALVHEHRDQFNLSENHCEKAVSYARLFEGPEEIKCNLLFQSLKVYCNLRMHQGNYADALTVAEEAYDCVAVTYNPVHPDVQAAASILIGCLTIKGELYDAERLAKFTLDILKDPANKLDQESEAVANGYFDLAKVIYKQEGDLERAAMLVRESLRIRTLINHKDHLYVTYSASLLASILQSKKQLDKEMKEQLDHDLATNITNEGEEGINTVKSYINLGRFYHRYAHTFELTDNLRFVFLRYSEVNYRPAVRIYTKIHGLDNAITTEVSSALAIVSDELDLLEDARDALGDPRDA